MDKQTKLKLKREGFRSWDLKPSNLTLTDTELALLDKEIGWFPEDGPRLLYGECQILDNTLDAHEPYETVRAIREKCEREL